MFFNSDARYKEKKICIFTNYRTGSSFLNSRIAATNNLLAIGEHFNYYNIKNNLPLFDTCYTDLISKPRFAVKLMADHLVYNNELIEKVLTKVDKIIYLYRKDFTAQAKSYISSASTNTFMVTGLKETFQTPEDSVITVADLEQSVIDNYIDTLKKNYYTMAYFYKKFSGDLLCLEDFKIKNPYQKTIMWGGKEPVIPEFDVESLFK
jgi:hypothetical protein